MVPYTKAVLFDLDGVIVYTDRFHYLAWKKLADQMGWSFDIDLNDQLRGVPRMESLQIILDHNNARLSDAEKQKLAGQKNAYYIEMIQKIDADSLVPGAVEFIKAIRGRGVKTALCSSSRNAATVLEKLNLTQLFDAVVTGGDLQRAKPDPEIFLLAAGMLGIHPFQCIVFEDAESGVLAAIRAKMKVVGFGRGNAVPSAPEVVETFDEVDLESLMEYGRARKRYPVEPWTITETEPELRNQGYWESVFALSNGYLGVRGAAEEDDMPQAKPGTFVNGVYERAPKRYSNYDGMPDYDQKFINHNDWRVIRLRIGDETFSLTSGQIVEYERRLDMKRGILNRKILWQSPSGKQVRIETSRLVSNIRYHSAVISYRATPINFSGRVALESVVKQNASLPYGREELSDTARKVNDDGTQVFIYRTQHSGIESAMACAHMVDSPGHCHPHIIAGEKETVYVAGASLKENQTISLTKHICVFTSLDETPDVEGAALEAVRRDANDGYETMEKEQIEHWRGYWEIADIAIEGNTADNQATRFSMYHLRQAHNPENLRSIPATGLTGENYNGAVFWDTDMFMLPTFAYSEPMLARKLAEYRRRTMEPARWNAEKMGKRGVKFSWNTLDGHENSPSIVEGPAQYHINADVAYGMWRYYQTSLDEDFLCDVAAEVMFEVARFYADLGQFIPLKGDRFCINFVSGPDEYNYCVNNNCYTNVMAQFQIAWSLWIYERLLAQRPKRLKEIVERIGLEESELDYWRRIVERMFIPYNEELGIYEQDDTYLYRNTTDVERFPHFYEFKRDMTIWEMGRLNILKQADTLLMMAMFPEKYTDEDVKTNYDFYIQRTRHASSLSPSIHSLLASRVGYNDEAYDLFRASAYMDLFDYKRNTYDGIHFACCGGTWLAIVNGFAGMKDTGDSLSFRPRLPKAWSGYQFKIRWRGRLIHVQVEEGRVTYSLLDGEEKLSFYSSGKEVELGPDSRRVVLDL